MAKFFVPLVAPPPMNNGGGGGSDLPAVSAADNGDVLTVVNGAWDKAAPGGGGGGGSSVFIVNATLDEALGLNVLDKTAGEIIEAFDNSLVIIKRQLVDGVASAVLYLVEESVGEYYFAINGLTFVASSLNDYPTESY